MKAKEEMDEACWGESDTYENKYMEKTLQYRAEWRKMVENHVGLTPAEDEEKYKLW